ncbi:Fic family protein [Streptomyces sp. SP18ES09]|uniref:Fic family protein n=1 Tax=Streptomyces sp. SP18ES09 TaxID=3002532 RepID=UPI002E779AC8|nr:Fic family protein [Streptomyces sp. SP18ES09]MEE1820166.1 Fic family protein [Streptomyces sp. SP18ES09]
MSRRPSGQAVRRVMPVVPPLDVEEVPAAERAAATSALAALAETTLLHLDAPDLFHRPRFRTAVHSRHVARLPEHEVTERIADAAERRAAAGLLAVASTRAELLERPGRRPCFTPSALCELHEMIVAGDPNIPSPGGFRRSASRVVWDDGRTFAIAVAPGRELRGHMDRWYRWATRTTAPALDAAAFGMARLMTIHPFADANGRTARLIAQCDLVAAGLMPGLLLDLEGWIHSHRLLFDETLVAAAAGEWAPWASLFARMVAETARHRTDTVVRFGGALASEAERWGDDPAASAVLARLRSTPAVSEEWLRGRVPYDPGPALARLAAREALVPHPRLPGAFVHPPSLAILDEPWTPAVRAPETSTA